MRRRGFLRGVPGENKNPTLDVGKKLWYSDDRSDPNSWAGTLQGPDVWPGLRREHDPEKPGARSVARTEARARFRGARSILIGKNYGMPMTARIPTLGLGPYRGPKCGQD